MSKRSGLIVLLMMFSLLCGYVARAQSPDLVATLEKIEGGVEVKRVKTDVWVTINKESLVGVGDSIRTDSKGRARVTFFANGTDTEVLPGSEFRIDTFAGTENQFQLAVTVVIGQTSQRISKLLDAGSTYSINSTGLELAVRGTVLSVRVEQGGRSATIVDKGAIVARNNGDATGKTPVDVPAGFGVRAEASKGVSDVVPATSFAELDTALDGCPNTVDFGEDVKINLRTGPKADFPRVGNLENGERIIILGVTKSSLWFRTPYKGGYAWFYGPRFKIDAACPPLRKFADDAPGEDANRYKGLDSDINLSATPQPKPSATAIPSATPKAKLNPALTKTH